ncbi:protein eva-1 homolog A isoform X1 [Gadus macrocephalus]|uniref:protein eva-1 homolog A isoform X1 n=2 Tax=Gadus macrocephalus TaxID=80720 RepID=UPI0028CB95A3|nr:protein eva-1 homolog A isoform X1 [Gadus macrocephalus]XP_059927536.1 protein eva-1 homolog A isoform X1 [Gadus macrocephalus]XP_059927537.1 protein eva-1 homolog A isoform X1 [Gadus macrocephalus]
MSAPPTGSPNTDVTAASQEMAMLSNMLAAYTFVADHPERTGLVFLAGVCVGLLVTLCAIVFQIHCRTDCHYGNSHRPQHPHRSNKARPQHPPQHQLQHQHQHQLHDCPRNSNQDNMTLIPAGGHVPSGDNQSEDWEDPADMSARQRRRFERALLSTRVFTSADDLDRSQRLEERERILREIWMNGQPDIRTVTQSLNRYY